jgi:hypothetical protein
MLRGLSFFLHCAGLVHRYFKCTVSVLPNNKDCSFLISIHVNGSQSCRYAIFLKLLTLQRGRRGMHSWSLICLSGSAAVVWFRCEFQQRLMFESIFFLEVLCWSGIWDKDKNWTLVLVKRWCLSFYFLILIIYFGNIFLPREVVISLLMDTHRYKVTHF